LFAGDEARLKPPLGLMASTDHERWKPMTRTDRLDLEPQLQAGQPAADEFRSILFDGEDGDVTGAQEPPFFSDLNLDQVVDAIVAERDEYDLKPFFYTPLRTVEAVAYRHEVFRELEVDGVRAAVHAFAGEMQKMRRYLTLAQKQHYRLEKQRWFLDAATIYCDAVSALEGALIALDLSSRGFQTLREYLIGYTSSERFTSLAGETRTVLDGLAQVKYTLRIKGSRVTVSTYEGEPDYSIEVERTFERFRQGAVENHLITIPDSGTMDHVEARIAQLVARLYPDAFRALAAFCKRHRGFLDPRLARFDREVQIYLAYLEHTERLAGVGLSFCYPAVSASSKEIAVEEAFDIALAAKLARERSTVVSNDFSLRDHERVLVVTGPNQGGKTTFARMFGQLHYLVGLGLPVPGRNARLFLPDRVFTHFEREEDIATLRGKLDDELMRVREIIEEATGDSVVVLNEIFTSTTLEDAVFLGTEVLKQIVDRGCLGVCVTFVDELASLSEATVSMVATVNPADPSERTFKIVRKPADGRAYAWAIAAKYGLSYDLLRSRIDR
jgi:DNA mismatch repair protein MutS